MKKSNKKINDKLNSYYVVDKILDKKIINSQPQYLIKWKNYSEFNNTWEPLSNLADCDELLEEFEVSYKLNKYTKNNEEITLLNKKKNVDNSVYSLSSSKSESSPIDKKNYLKNNIDCEENSKNVDSNISKNSNKNKNNLNSFMNEKLVKNSKELSSINLDESFNKNIKNSNLYNNNLSHKNFTNININDKKNKIENFNSNSSINEKSQYENLISGKIKGKGFYTDLSSDDESGSNSEENKFSVLKTNENLMLSKVGDINLDEPIRIKSARINEKKELICMIEWKPRDDIKIVPSEYSNIQIKRKHPFLLIDFYEERLKFKEES